MNWNSFQSDTGYSSWGTYEQSKLANVLFTNELAARFGKQGVTAVSLHPGVVKTELWREFENNGAKKSYVCLFKVMKPVFSVFAKNSAEGAQTTIYCAVDDKVPQQNGEYFA
jgi:NAD(P)-dependent dehydrogenase (short-subunit alcohol dehydrogenase family)